jgi:hypothetical protein
MPNQMATIGPMSVIQGLLNADDAKIWLMFSLKTPILFLTAASAGDVGGGRNLFTFSATDF